MGFLERCDAIGMTEGESNVIPAVQQAVPAEGIDSEIDLEARDIADRLRFKIDSQPVAFGRRDTAEDFIDLGIGEGYRQDAVLEAVIIEDIRVARREDGTDAVVEDGPGRVLTA